MRCCSYPGPHLHYPAWLRAFPAVNVCNCGRHRRTLTLAGLLNAWNVSHAW